MTLELNRVAGQIDDMGRALAGRARREREALPAAQALLHQFATEQDALRQVAESEAGQRLRCACPGDERLDEQFPTPAMPSLATIVATDGSQIYPDRHGLVFYYALNVGGIVFRHGSGQAPEVSSEPCLYYRDDQIYPGGEMVSGDMVSAERNLAEMNALARLALQESAGGPPCLALGDGPLLIWLQRTNLPERYREQVLADYMACLDRLRAEAVPVAGLVSRPHSAEVVALLYLAQKEPPERQAVRSLAESPFRGLTDRALFGFLRPGERSALFVRGTAANQDFRDRGHTIFFFYLHTGSDLARVELPEWTARRPEQLDLVHAALYSQCVFNNGYPYVLTRADELAVILGEERETMEDMIVQAMMKHGLPLPELSRKAQQKQVARWRRHH